MKNIFKLKGENSCNMRQVSEYSRPIVNGVYHGAQIISYLRQKYGICFQKNQRTLTALKRRLKQGNLIIMHVGCIKFILKAQNFSNSIQLKISLRDFCALRLYYHRIYKNLFNVILYMRILVELSFFISFFIFLFIYFFIFLFIYLFFIYFYVQQVFLF